MTHNTALFLATVLRLLGDAQWRLYNANHDAASLDASILTAQLAACIISTSSSFAPSDAALLLEVGSRLKARYNEHGKLDDLHGAILSLQDASKMCHGRDSCQEAVLNLLGLCLVLRFGRLGGLDDIDGAVTIYNRAVELLLDGDIRKPMALINYSNACFMRFKRTNRSEDLDRLVSTFERALELLPEGHPERPNMFDKLGNSYSMRFEHNGRRPNDIEQAVLSHQRAVELTADGSPNTASHLHNLGMSLTSRFSVSHDLADIEQAISIHIRVAGLTPDNHPSRPSRLGRLVESFFMRYTHTKLSSDLEQVIPVCERAVALTPDQHPIKPLLLHRLGSCFSARFESTAELEDLRKAVSANRRVVELASDGDPNKLAWLRIFGDSSLELSHHTDDADDIERGAWAYQQAIRLTPSGDADLPALLYEFGEALARFFERTGERESIDAAVAVHRRAIGLTPDDDPTKPFRLHSLATSLSRRHEHTGESDDIEGAVSLYKHAAALVPDTHPAKLGLLSNLAAASLRRFQGSTGGDLGDLEASIDTYRRCIDLAPDGHPHKPAMFSDLSLALSARFQRLGMLDDIEKAVSAGRRAIDSVSDGHPELASYYNNAAKCLWERYMHTKDTDDLSSAISMYQLATDLCPKDQPNLSVWLGNYGTVLKSRFENTQTQADFDSAVHAFSSAATNSFGTPDFRLTSAIKWAGLLEAYPAFGAVDALLTAHSFIITMLPDLIWLGFDIRRRLSDCRMLGKLVNAAVASAVNVGSLGHAIDWFEAGRSLIWSQMFLLRAPLDELQEKQPELANELRRVQQLLQQSAPNSFASDTDDLGGVEGVTVNVEGEQHRQLTFEHQKVLEDIRGCPGFEHFMERGQPEAGLPPPGLLSGPIVFLNVYRTRCDAIILHPSGEREAVPLLNLSSKRAAELRWRWVEEVMGYRYHSSRGANDAERADGRRSIGKPDRLQNCLHLLWDWVVRPVMEALEYTSVVNDKRLPHITWCPTGPLMQLPLHAAGLYNDPNGPRAYNFAVHSYTPYLSALVRACAGIDELHPPREVLIVTQPATPKQAPLSGTIEEASRLERILRTSGVRDKWLNDAAATVDSVRTAMTEHPWVHLACHGSQNIHNPMESAFHLFDGPLTLTDLMSTMTDNVELAFLSACETAVGDEKTPEESTHLAAGMLAVGFKGVVATMWSIQDADAPIVVEAYHKELLALRSSGTIGKAETGAAYALHEATRVLREKVGEAAFARWVPFVHFGI